MPRVPDLRERVIIERPIETLDEMGGRARSWAAVATVWAKITGRSGEERFERGIEAATVNHRVVIRHRRDLDAGCRLIWRGGVLDVTAAYDADGDRRWLTIEAQEGAPA